jgi:hypothetical protein
MMSVSVLLLGISGLVGVAALIRESNGDLLAQIAMSLAWLSLLVSMAALVVSMACRWGVA